MIIRAVIWDLGGVLVRTTNASPREELAKRLGMTRLELEKLVYSGESGTRAQKGEISIHHHWENVRNALRLSPEEFTGFQDQFWGGDFLDMDLVHYIRSLRSSYKTGLLSNAFSNLRDVVTNQWKFSDAFDDMVISSEVGIMKPDPRIYNLALERLSVHPHEAVFIDDFSDNVEGARSMHMTAIHFRSPAQAQADLERILMEGGR